jgi:hypothetical protein
LKPIFYFISFAILFASCKSSSTLTKKTERKETKENQKLADNIIDSASENLGVRYRFGGQLQMVMIALA